MGWTQYTARFGARRPAFLPPVADPEACTRIVRSGLDWMHPDVRIEADRSYVRLTMSAPSADAALAHLRGSLRSALYTAGVPEVGNWPLHLLSVEEGKPVELRAVG